MKNATDFQSFLWHQNPKIIIAEHNFHEFEGFDSIFEVVNKSMSTYLPNSDISKINKGNKDVKVDQMFREVFNLSKEIFFEFNLILLSKNSFST